MRQVVEKILLELVLLPVKLVIGTTIAIAIWLTEGEEDDLIPPLAKGENQGVCEKSGRSNTNAGTSRSGGRYEV